MKKILLVYDTSLNYLLLTVQFVEKGLSRSDKPLYSDAPAMSAGWGGPGGRFLR